MGFETIETNIRRRHNKVMKYITTRSILDLRKTSERNQGEQVGIRWWEQAGIDLEGARNTEEEEKEEYDGISG